MKACARTRTPSTGSGERSSRPAARQSGVPVLRVAIDTAAVRHGNAMKSAPVRGPLRILFVVRSLDAGGAERQLYELVRSLDPVRFTPCVVTMYPGGRFADELARASHVQLVCLEKRRRWDVARFASGLLSLARRFKPHVVQGLMPVANEFALVCGRLTGAKVVWGLRSSYVDFTAYDRLHALSFQFSRRLSRWPDRIVLNSWAGREFHVRQGFEPSRMVVIPNGIDCNLFRRDALGASRFRASWRIPPDAPLVGAVGRLDHMKDLGSFVRAFALASVQVPNLHAVCVGAGTSESREALHAVTVAMGTADRMHFAPAQADMPAVYSALDAQVSSSLGEGFSNVIAEGMACGIPAAVTDVGDSARIVGALGEVAPPRSPDLLATAMVRVLARRGSTLTAMCRDRILREFSLERMVESTSVELEALR